MSPRWWIESFFFSSCCHLFPTKKKKIPTRGFDWLLLLPWRKLKNGVDWSIATPFPYHPFVRSYISIDPTGAPLPPTWFDSAKNRLHGPNPFFPTKRKEELSTALTNMKKKTTTRRLIVQSVESGCCCGGPGAFLFNFFLMDDGSSSCPRHWKKKIIKRRRRRTWFFKLWFGLLPIERTVYSTSFSFCIIKYLLV